MKNRFTLLLAFLMLSTTTSLLGQTRNVGDFDAVSISSGITAKLVKASSPSVDFTVRKGDPDDLITEVKNGVLYVRTRSKNGGWGNSVKVNVIVNYTNLEKIKVSSGCTVKSENTVNSNTMEIEVSSGSTAHFDVEANRIEVDVTSGSTLKLEGSADRGDFEVSSGSTLNAYHFVTDDAEVEASSGSSLSIHVNNSLDATASSGASVSYTGSVKNKNIDAGWSGSVKRRN